MSSDIVRAFLPYQTGFEPSPTEAYTLGDLTGQEDWLATPGLVTVQNEVVDSGTQAARLNASGAKASHFFDTSCDAVETVLHVKLSSSAIFPPAVLPAGVAFLVSFDPTRGVMAFDGDGNDGGSWTVVPDSLLPDQWIEMRIVQNFSLAGSPPHTWGVFVAGHGSMTNLGFKADNVDSLNGTHIMSGPTDTNYLDNITIQEVTSVPW